MASYFLEIITFLSAHRDLYVGNTIIKTQPVPGGEANLWQFPHTSGIGIVTVIYLFIFYVQN